MITPPAITPLPAATSAETEGQASTAKTEQVLSLTGGIACWPIAIVALLAGMGLLSWLRSASHKKP
jgi:nitrate reductase NapE component